MEWYVLFVRGGKEAEICSFLKERGFNAFFPKKEVLYKKKGIKYKVLKPLFPSYIFIESNLAHKNFSSKLLQFKSIKQGIIRELKYEDDVVALDKQEKKFLQKLLDNNYTAKESVGMIVNDKVIINDGPLKGYESKIIHIDRHKHLCTLELMMLGQTREIQVSLEIIVKNVIN